MPITPEQARAELARRRGMASSTTALPQSKNITPEQARAELERRKALAQPQPTALGTAAGIGKDLALGALSGFSSIGRTIKSNTMDPIGKKLFGKDNLMVQESKPYAPDTTAGKVGNFVGEAVPYFAGPGTAALGTLPFASRMGTRMLFNGGVATAQTGDVGKGATTAVVSEAITGAAGPVGKLGKGLYKGLAIPTSATEAAKVQAYKANNPLPSRVMDNLLGTSKAPITSAETAFSKNLWGSQSMLGVQANRGQKEIWKTTVAPALKSIKEPVDLNSFFDDAERAIMKNVPEKTRQKSLINALSAVREDYAGTSKVSMEELQNLKSGWAEFVPEKSYRGESIAGSLNSVRKVLADNARDKILTSINNPDVKRAYIDYGNLVDVKKLGTKAMTGDNFKGVNGSFISAAKDMAVTPLATTGGLLTYHGANKGAKYLGTPGAKTISDYLLANPEAGLREE